MRALQARLVEHGVSFGHWTFLRILWERDGLTQRELSNEAGVMEPSTFAAIKAMEELGYVRREQLPDNRKNMYVHLTPKGRALREKLVPLAEEVNRIAVRSVSAADVETTRRTLLTILGSLADDEARGRAVSRPSSRRSAPPPRSAGSKRGSPPRTPEGSSPRRRFRAE